MSAVRVRESHTARTFRATAPTTRAIIAAHREAHAYAQSASREGVKLTLLREGGTVFRVLEDSTWDGSEPGRWLATYYGGRRFDGYRIPGDQPTAAINNRSPRT